MKIEGANPMNFKTKNALEDSGALRVYAGTLSAILKDERRFCFLIGGIGILCGKNQVKVCEM